MAMLLLPVRGAVFLLTVFVAVPGGGPPTAGALLALWAVVYCFSRGECPERPGAMGCGTPLPVSSCPLRDTGRRVRQPMAPDESARILARARRSTCSNGKPQFSAEMHREHRKQVLPHEDSDHLNYRM